MTRSYAIGDIHGHLDKLQAIHALIKSDQNACGDTSAPVVHIGDLVDRGPDSKGVIQYLIDGQALGENWVVLKGNHDRMMELFLRDYPQIDTQLRHEYSWLHPRIGGIETLASYGVEVTEAARTFVLHATARAHIGASHREFLTQSPTSFHHGEIFFAHAGIRPDVALEDQTEDDLCWIRQEFYKSDADHGPLIVHGHTPIDQVTHYGNRLNIDTGAAYGKKLSAVVFEGREVYELTTTGRQKLQPPEA
jgi:serine/threonine protein phosphatase 1